MATQLTFRRGTSEPTQASGLTLGEPAFNTALSTFHIGRGAGVTAAWIGAQISGLSTGIAAGLTTQVPTMSAVKDYVASTTSGVATLNSLTGTVTLAAGTNIGVTSASGSITVTNLGVQTFNGLTGAVGGVTTSAANTFTALNTFSAGISTAGGTFGTPTQLVGTNITGTATGLTAGRVVTNANLTGHITSVGNATSLGSFTSQELFDALGVKTGTSTIVFNTSPTLVTPTIGAATATSVNKVNITAPASGSTLTIADTKTLVVSNTLTFTGTDSSSVAFGAGGTVVYAATNVASFNGATGAVTGVSSFNGLTGAVGGVTTSAANTFTALNTFNAGISAAGGVTFAGDIAVNGGNITTTSATATLFNATATSLDILNTQSTGFTLSIGNASTSSGRKNISIGGNISGGASSVITIGSANSSSRVSILGGITLGGGVGGVVGIASSSPFEVASSSTLAAAAFSGLLTANAGISAAGGVTFAGDIAVNGGDITTTSATATVFNATATTLSIGSAVTSWTIGATSGTATIRIPKLVLGDSTNAGAESKVITTPVSDTNNLFISPNGNLILAPEGSSVTEGTRAQVTITNTVDAGGTVTIAGGNLVLSNKSADDITTTPVNIIFEGATNNANDTTLTVVDPTANRTITLPDASGIVALTSQLMGAVNGSTAATNAVTSFNGLTGAVGGVTTSAANTFTAVQTFNNGITASTLDVSGTARTTGNMTVGATLTVTGNLIVNGTTTTINSTTLSVDDKNIILADGNALDASADGGGITLKGATDKTFNWVDATDSWTSSEHMDLAATKVFKIGTSTVLSSSALGSGVTGSSLTAVGTLTTGVWQATAIGATYGGTGLTSYTIGDVIYASGTSSLTKLSTTTAGYLLAANGAGAAPEYKQFLVRDAAANSIATVTSGSGTLTATIQNATSSAKGVASFDNTNFTVSTGAVTITGVDGGTY
jgi:hypothetical protein